MPQARRRFVVTRNLSVYLRPAVCEGCGDRRVCASDLVRAGECALERPAVCEGCGDRRVCGCPCSVGRVFRGPTTTPAPPVFECLRDVGARFVILTNLSVSGNLATQAHLSLPPSSGVKRGSRSMALPALGCLSSDAGGAAQASAVGAESAECASRRRQAVPALGGVRVEASVNGRR